MGNRSDRYGPKVTWLPLFLDIYYVSIFRTFHAYLKSFETLQPDEVGIGIQRVIRQNGPDAVKYIFLSSLFRLMKDYSSVLLDQGAIPLEVKHWLSCLEEVFPQVATTLVKAEGFVIYLMNYISAFYISSNVISGVFCLKPVVKKALTWENYLGFFEALRKDEETFSYCMGSYLRIVQSISNVAFTRAINATTRFIGNGSYLCFIRGDAANRSWQIFSSLEATGMRDADLLFMVGFRLLSQGHPWIILQPNAGNNGVDSGNTMFILRFPRYQIANLDSFEWTDSKLGLVFGPTETHWPPAEVDSPRLICDFDHAVFQEPNFFETDRFKTPDLDASRPGKKRRLIDSRIVEMDEETAAAFDQSANYCEEIGEDAFHRMMADAQLTDAQLCIIMLSLVQARMIELDMVGVASIGLISKTKWEKVINSNQMF